MRNYTLSREQSLTLDIIKKNRLSALLYLDKLNLSSTLIHSITQYLKEGKRSILVLESQDLIQIIKEKIENTSLKHLFLFLENDDYLDQHDLARIRTMAKERKEDLSMFVDTETQLENKQKRIVKALEDQADKIFGERRWRDLVMLPRRTDKVLNTLKYQFDMELTQHEFWHIRGLIEEAKGLYDKGHLISEQIAATFNISLDSDEKINKLRSDLIEIKEQLESIIYDLDLELYSYRQRIHRKLEEEYVSISDLIEEASLMLKKINAQPTASSDNSFSFFGTKNENKNLPVEKFLEIRNKLTESILIHSSDSPDKWDLEAIDLEVTRWKSQLSNWKENRDSITLKMIKSLNKNNSDTGKFKDIDRKFTLLFQKINELGIFNEQLENTSLNTYNQYLSADKWLSHIKLCLAYLNENREIIIWENFYGNLPIDVQNLISSLKKFDLKEWIPLYEKWYLEKLLEKHFNPDNVIIDKLLEDHDILDNKYQTMVGKSIDVLFHDMRMSSLESCKNRNKEIYNKLIKKKNVDDLRLFDLIWTEKQMMSYFFPAIIISSKLLRSNRLLKDGSWDQVFCERTEIFSHIEKFTLLDQKTCFLSPLSESFKICNNLNLKIDDKKQLAKLLIHEYNFDKPIAELPLSDRLRAGKKLSKILLSLNQQVSIFQMRNANIISILPSQLKKEMVEFYDDSGIKEILVEDSLYETVTESIIAVDREKYLIFQDQLLSLDHVDSFQWQLKAIKSFRSSGFNIINVNTLKYRYDTGYFGSFLQESIPRLQEEENLVPKEA